MRGITVPLMLAAGLALGWAGAVTAGDVKAGKAKAQVCAGCHGDRGEGKTDGENAYPALSCQSELYLRRSMESYKTGKRVDPIMNAVFAGLSQDDIDNLAAYYASLRQ